MACDIKPVEFASRAEMADRLADSIEDRLARAIEARGAAVMAVSGGSTPAGLYAALSRRKLDWSNVTAVLVDERWAAPGEDGSNESFIKETLQQNEAAKMTFVGLWSGAPSPFDGVAEADARLENVARPFDVVVLGMGEDGHTASWFPHSAGLDVAIGRAGPPVAAIKAERSNVTGDYLDRITLTLAAIQDARFICILIAGAGKREAFDRACSGGPIEEMPVRAIIDARNDLLTAWVP